MCFWPFVSYVHALSTTDAHQKQRRKHKYSKRCSQCLKKLDETNHVAAHVVAYPCFCINFCFGILTLKTTCKKCNNYNKTGKRKVDKRSWFFLKPICSGECTLGKKIKYITQPSCIHYNYDL